MWRYLLLRLASAVVTVLGVVTLVFLLVHLVPGDPVDVMLGESARPAERAALRAALGLDRPLGVQWLDYVGGVLQLDLGMSLHARRPVASLIAERLPATVSLAAAALGIALVFALPLGVLAAVRRNSIWDRLAVGAALVGIAVPSFWLGPVLILVFSLGLGWLPVTGADEPFAIVLPAITLGAALAGLLARMVRTGLCEVLAQDYVRTARAKGLGEGAVIWRHALANAALPVATIAGLQLGGLLAGAVVTETVFAWPGIGSLTVAAIERRDYPLLQGCVLLVGLVYVVANALTDLACAALDPRLHSGP